MTHEQRKTHEHTPLHELEDHEAFVGRHIGPRASEIDAMLRVVGAGSLDELIETTLPPSIRLEAPLELPDAESETDTLARLRGIARQNVINHSMIGLGYHDTILPAVIQRNVLENPGWYTANTPYQAEISQGRL